MELPNKILALFLLANTLTMICFWQTFFNRQNEDRPKVFGLSKKLGLTSETGPGVLRYRGEWIRTDYPEVLQLIRNLTVGPAYEPYNLTRGSNYSAVEFFELAAGEPWVDVLIVMETLLPKGQPRIFLECGANEGEIGSNTLYLERYRNWTGLLIEPDPIYFEELKKKHRKAVQVNACVSPHGNASVLTLQHAPFDSTVNLSSGAVLVAMNPGRSHLVGYNDGNYDGDPRWSYIDVLCLPMYHIMLASNMPSFDFVVLDVEEAELPILETIPFDKVEMKFVLVEMIGKEYQKKVISFFREKNYTLHAIYSGNTHPENGLFVRNDFYDPTKIRGNYSLAEVYELLVSDKNFCELTPQERGLFRNALKYSSEVIRTDGT